MRNSFDDYIKNAASDFVKESSRRDAVWKSVSNELEAIKWYQKSSVKWASSLVLVALLGIGYSLQLGEANDNEKVHANLNEMTKAEPAKAIEVPETIEQASEKLEKIEKAKPGTASSAKASAPAKSDSKKSSIPKTAPSIAIQLSALKSCVGDAVAFNSNLSTDEYLLKWSFGDGMNSTNASPKHAYAEAGRYFIELTAIHKQTNEQISSKQTVALEVNPRPNAWFEASCEDISIHNPSMCFIAHDSLGEHVWHFGDKRTSTAASPKHLYAQKGLYKVKHVLTNTFGCKDSSIQQVRVIRGYNLMAMPTFNPQEDKTWMPIALLDGKDEFELTIMNESGEIVFKTNSADKLWNGTSSGSNQLASQGETYLWLARVTENGNLREYGGSIVIKE